MTTLYLILIILAVALVGGIVYLSCLPANFKVSRSRVMKIPAKRIFNSVLDFRFWPKWSPWLMHEPNAKVTYSDKVTEVGGYQSWDGRMIGAGKLTHVRIDEFERIQQKIEFIRPFRSESKIEWRFTPTSDGGTKVTWSMQGRMPFLFRFMTKKMDGMIGMDYAMGLLMLNHQLDPKSDRFGLEFGGKEKRTGVIAAYEACSSSMQDLPNAMQQAFNKVDALIKEKKIKVAAPAFTAYHKVNRKMTHFVYDCAVPVDAATAGKSKSDIRKYAGGNYFKVRYRGNYDYLKYAWYVIMSHIRMGKFKLDKSRPSLEVYTKDITQVKSPNDCVTDIFVPIR